VAVRPRHRWAGFSEGGLLIETPEGQTVIRPAAVLLALGGASWPRLGSNAAWTGWLAGKGVAIAPFRPANCGFDLDWEPGFAERFAGAPVKAVAATSAAGTIRGEFVVTSTGIEGSLVYAHAAALRDSLEQTGQAVLSLDLAPERNLERLERDLVRQDPKASFSNRVRKAAHIDGVKAGLLRHCATSADLADPVRLARRIKGLPLALRRPRPIAEAISSAGGVPWSAIDGRFMLKALPGIFVAGEMIDWEAPTGGYLLTACMATGRAAARGIDAWLGENAARASA
jgi:uncharacterized flavoprotein (TIGR03862 family)